MATAPKYSFRFPGQSPTDLKADPFLGRFVLQHAPERIFRDAEGQPHPWRFLLAVPGLPSCCYALFKAADSVSTAISLLLHTPYGGATLTRGHLAVEAQERPRWGGAAGAGQSAKKLIRALVRSGLWSFADQAGLATTPELEAMARQAQAELQKRHGRDFLAPVSTVDAFIEDHQHAYLMIEGWLRLGYPELNFGDPGLAYYTDAAMANLLTTLTGVRAKLHHAHARLIYFRKLRQRLGLLHAHQRKPRVFDARRARGADWIEIQMRRPDGRDFWKRWGDPLP